MVDVSDKSVSTRKAVAQSCIQLPTEIGPFLKGEELHLKKGPVFQTAIIAGTMAIKRTDELIPFCHLIPIEGINFKISINDKFLVTITCEVKTTYKTGVEMEALLGASIAALTIYDMCKAISHQMTIQETKLLSKSGGRRNILTRPTYGLVLTGGKSERMKTDKALIDYNGKPHAAYIFETLKKYCPEVYLSARENQWKETELSDYPTIIDEEMNLGPIGGLLSAFKKFPDVNWIVVACDLVYFNDEVIKTLLAEADEEKVATAFKNDEKGFPEALCAFYTPSVQDIFREALKQDIRCPVKVLRNVDTKLLNQDNGINLANINTIDERRDFKNEIH